MSRAGLLWVLFPLAAVADERRLSFAPPPAWVELRPVEAAAPAAGLIAEASSEGKLRNLAISFAVATAAIYFVVRVSRLSGKGTRARDRWRERK